MFLLKMTETELQPVHNCEMKAANQCHLSSSTMFSTQGVWTTSMLTFPLGANRRLRLIVVALHYVNTPMQNIIMSAQNIISGFRTASLSRRFYE